MLFYVQVIQVIKSTIHSKSAWYICKLLTNYVLNRILPKGVSADEYLNHVIFPAKVQTSKPIDVPYIRVYVWCKDDKHVIWMWIWLILKDISLLERIESLWLVHFAQSPANFIFLLGRLIFSVSINSHPDNIYISLLSCWLLHGSLRVIKLQPRFKMCIISYLRVLFDNS